MVPKKEEDGDDERDVGCQVPPVQWSKPQARLSSTGFVLPLAWLAVGVVHVGSGAGAIGIDGLTIGLVTLRL